jgi:hypothetical protein
MHLLRKGRKKAPRIIKTFWSLHKGNFWRLFLITFSKRLEVGATFTGLQAETTKKMLLASKEVKRAIDFRNSLGFQAQIEDWHLKW